MMRNAMDNRCAFVSCPHNLDRHCKNGHGPDTAKMLNIGSIARPLKVPCPREYIEKGGEKSEP